MAALRTSLCEDALIAIGTAYLKVAGAGAGLSNRQKE